MCYSLFAKEETLHHCFDCAMMAKPGVAYMFLEKDQITAAAV